MQALSRPLDLKMVKGLLYSVSLSYIWLTQYRMREEWICGHMSLILACQRK